MKQDCDVVVVGAGFSGLRTALELRKAGLDVRVLEARNRVGGRAKRGELAGQTVDLGGQWQGIGHDRLGALAREHGVSPVQQYDTGRRVLDLDGTVRSYRGLIPSLPLPALLETGLTLWRLKGMTRTVPAEAPWQARRAPEWDGQTLQDWMQRHVRTRAARSMMDLAAHAILGADPDQFSLLYFLHYLRASGGFDYMAEVSSGAQAIRFEGGVHQLAQRMAQELGDRVVLDSPVERVHQDEDTVHVYTRHRDWQARRVIIAASPALLERIAFEPALPAARRELHARMPMGSVIKVHVAYAQPFWRDAGFSGEVVGDDEFGPVFDGGPADGSVGILTGFIAGGPARRWHGRATDERRAKVIECLVRWFGADASTPIDYVDQDWREEEWSAGCYTAIMPPGIMTACGQALREPCGRIHWAGTETATHWTGYFEGALLAGERAAAEVVAADGKMSESLPMGSSA